MRVINLLRHEHPFSGLIVALFVTAIVSLAAMFGPETFVWDQRLVIWIALLAAVSWSKSLVLGEDFRVHLMTLTPDMRHLRWFCVIFIWVILFVLVWKCIYSG